MMQNCGATPSSVRPLTTCPRHKPVWDRDAHSRRSLFPQSRWPVPSDKFLLQDKSLLRPLGGRTRSVAEALRRVTPLRPGLSMVPSREPALHRLRVRAVAQILRQGLEPSPDRAHLRGSRLQAETYTTMNFEIYCLYFAFRVTSGKSRSVETTFQKTVCTHAFAKCLYVSANNISQVSHEHFCHNYHSGCAQWFTEDYKMNTLV